MDVRQLRYMLEVIESGSLMKAAERLHVSQPALTKSIKRLEDAVGVPLFIRDGRGMKPTFYALHLRDYARAATVGLARSLQEISALKTGSMGVVTLATPPVLAASLVAEALVQLSRTAPDLQVRVLVEVDDLFPSLERGRCDLVFAMSPRSDRRFPGLRQALLFDDEMVVIARPSHPLLKSVLRPHDLVEAGWALPLAGNILRGRLELIFDEAGLPPPSARVECEGPELIKRLVRGTDYLGWVPRLACSDELAAGTLAVARLPSSYSHRKIGIFWRDYSLSPGAVLVSGALEAACLAAQPAAVL